MEQISWLCLLFITSCANNNADEFKTVKFNNDARALQVGSVNMHVEQIGRLRNKAKLIQPKKLLK